MAPHDRAPGREHLPNHPKGWVVLRALQLLLALPVIGLAAYSLRIFNSPGPGLSMFTTIVTLIVAAWLVAAHAAVPRLYNYWAALALDLFLWVFWSAALVLCAIEAWAFYYLNYTYCQDGGRTDDTVYGGIYDLRDYCNRAEYGPTHTNVMTALACIAGIEALFFFIAWITDAVVISRHRSAGLHSHAGAGLPMQPRSKTDHEAAAAASAPQGYYQPAAAAEKPAADPAPHYS